MTESHGQFPHALAAAHKELVAALETGIEQNKAHGQYSNSEDVCGCVECFVDAIYLTLGGRDELRRRAMFIETRCAEGSDYETTRARSLSSYRGQPRKLTGSKVAIDRLRKSNPTPLFLDDVNRIRQAIKRVLDERILNLNDAARQAYKSWHSACQEVGWDAEPLEVDGCFYLYHIREAGEDCPSELAESAKAVAQSPMGHTEFESIKAAADSMADLTKPDQEFTNRPAEEKPPTAVTTSENGGSTREDDDASDSELVAAATSKSCSVKLFRPQDKPLVNGKERDTLTAAQYDVVLALLNAGDKGLTKDKLDHKSGRGDSRKILKRLSDRDQDWQTVISFPGTTGKGYRIL